MKKLILIFLIISGCTFNQSKISKNNSNINFSDDLSLEEFKIKLEEYSKNSSYPNIDE